MPAVVLENIRSCYNVGNIIRTADALWYDVLISWYTPWPDKIWVSKTALGSEKSVNIKTFYNTKKANDFIKSKYWNLLAAEIVKWTSKNLLNYNLDYNDFWIVFWNELTWVLEETLEFVDDIIHIDMLWKKESLNVWQTSAIFMWELNKKLYYKS